MDRKALENSLKALAEEKLYIEQQYRLARCRSQSCYEDLFQNIADPDNPNAPIKISSITNKNDLFTLIAGDQEAALQKTYLEILERFKAVQSVLERDQIAVEAEKAGLHGALQTVATANAAIAAAGGQPQKISIPGTDEQASSDDDVDISANTLLSVAAEVVLSARRRAKGEGGTPDRYQERLETAVAAFIDIIGDLPLKNYLPIHMQEFATVMAEVPRNRSKYQEFKGLPLREIVSKNKKRKPPLPCLGVTTIHGSVSEVLNLWGRVSAGVDGVKDLRSYRIVMPSSAMKPTVREGLPVENLNKWVADAATKKPREADKRWLPLVAMLTGMRLGEIVWLQVSDLVDKDGYTVIDLRLPLIIDGKKVDRQLKTETSPRIVALPPFLIGTGFVDYVRAVRKRGWVFPRFHNAEDPADAASKQMKTWMVKLGIHERQRQTFHSLRHNAKHWYAVEYGERIADRQLGHAPANVSRRYGFRVLQAEEIEMIAAMSIPRGLDLSPYLGNAGT